MLWRRDDRTNPWFAAALINFIFMATHWLLFPSNEERLLLGSYVFVVVALVINLPMSGRVPARGASG